MYSNNEVGPVTRELYDSLTGIQTQAEADVFGWVRAVPMPEIEVE